jgi:hypothetical protein
MYDAVLGKTPAINNWNTMFVVCAAMFFVGGRWGSPTVLIAAASANRPAGERSLACRGQVSNLPVRENMNAARRMEAPKGTGRSKPAPQGLIFVDFP